MYRVNKNFCYLSVEVGSLHVGMFNIRRKKEKEKKCVVFDIAFKLEIVIFFFISRNIIYIFFLTSRGTLTINLNVTKKRSRLS